MSKDDNEYVLKKIDCILESLDSSKRRIRRKKFVLAIGFMLVIRTTYMIIVEITGGFIVMVKVQDSRESLREGESQNVNKC